MRKSNSGISRREFLWVSGSGVATFAAGVAIAGEARAVTPDKGAYGPFKMGFQSYSLRHFKTTDALADEAKKLNIGYVELYRAHLSPTSTPEQIEAVKKRLGAAGLTVNAFGVEAFTADHAKNDALFKFGKSVGVMNLSADPTKDAFPSLEKLVKQYDIRIAIHNHGPEDKRWKRPEWIVEAVKDLDPRIGACADLGHFIRAGVNPVEAIEMLGSRVLGVHLKDFDKNGKDVVIGQGQLDVVKALKALRKVGFNGPLSLEFEGDPENPVPKMSECLAVVRRAVRKI